MKGMGGRVPDNDCTLNGRVDVVYSSRSLKPVTYSMLCII